MRSTAAPLTVTTTRRRTATTIWASARFVFSPSSQEGRSATTEQIYVLFTLLSVTKRRFLAVLVAMLVMRMHEGFATFCWLLAIQILTNTIPP
jgi:hypothetical protein